MTPVKILVCAFLLCKAVDFSVATTGGGSKCTQPRIRLTNCTAQSLVRRFHFSSIQNRCRGYLTCNTTTNSSSNFFMSRDECERNCPATQCSLPSLPANGTYQQVDVNYQKMLQYSCQSGYTLKGGSQTRVCLYNGSWNGTEPYCERKTCSLPSQPANGRYDQVKIHHFNVLRYSCNPGFSLVGPSERSCLLDGTWTGKEPKCVDPSKVTCPEPEVIPNSNAFRQCLKVGCYVMYTCDKNHNFMDGNIWRRCMENGKWSGHPPICGRLIITHGDKEVGEELEANSGDTNVQIKCKMEPSFPSRVQVEWTPIPRGDNATWIENNTAFALQFQVVNVNDAGVYTCSITTVGVGSNIKKRIAIKVAPPKVPPTASIPPQLLTSVSSSRIELMGLFNGNPKPTVSWFKDGKQITSNDTKYEIEDKLPNSQHTTLSALLITDPVSTDLGVYRVEAVNDVGVLSYDIYVIGLTQQFARRSVDNEQREMIDADMTSICTTDNTVVFAGKYRRSSGQYTFILVDKVLPSSSQSSTALHDGLNNKVIKVKISPSTMITPETVLRLDMDYVFVVYKSSAKENDYVLARVYPGIIATELMSVCSS